MNQKEERLLALYKTLLKKSGYEYSGVFRVQFTVAQKIVETVNDKMEDKTIDPNKGMSFSEAEKWFAAARIANKERTILTASKNAWLDNECIAMLNLLVGLSANELKLQRNTIHQQKQRRYAMKFIIICAKGK